MHLLDGSIDSDILSLLVESSKANFSLLLSYGDMLKQKNINSVLILGLSSKGYKKNVKMSGSILLAEYLNQNDINIYIHDPFFEDDEINKLLPFAKVEKFTEPIKADAILLMADHRFYSTLSQNQLEELGFKEVKIIIDNTGILKYFDFGKKVLYHFIGDNNLIRLEE